MKRCPKCSSQYFDNMLDFCLEDGSKLLVVSEVLDRKPLRAVPPSTKSPTQADTLFIPQNGAITNPIDAEVETTQRSNFKSQLQIKSEKIKTSLTEKWFLFLKFTPMVLAIAHNYWQWLYLAPKSSSPLSDFLLSYQFLIWFLLLISGAVFGIISLKYGKSKSFAITALIILAINALLSIVPK